MPYLRRYLCTLPLACCLLFQVVGQSTFNKRFDTFGQMRQQGGWAVEAAGDGDFLAIHMSYYHEDPLLYFLTAVSRISQSGELLSVGRSPLAEYTTYCGWANSSDKTSDGRIVVGGNTLHPGDINRPALIFFHQDASLDTLIDYNLDEYQWIGRQAKQTPDGGFVVCGETTSTGYLDGFLLKTDPGGALEWVRTYGGPTYRDLIITVDLAPNGGYYLGGKREPTAFGSFDPWVLRVDSLGEVIWEDIYGSPFDDSPNAHLTTMADGLPVFAGGIAMGPQNASRPRLVKLDEDGAVLWERFYGADAIFNTTFFTVKEVYPGGDLIAAGQHYLSNLSVESFRSGMLLRTTSEGDSLWMRFYHYQDDDVPQGRGDFRDVLPTPDGGFIAVGTASSTPIHDQDLWVVKVDEHGCLQPGCHLITGMETQITNLSEALNVWPNPVTKGGTAQVEVQLPEGFKAQGQLRLTVVSGDGRLLLEKAIQGTAFQFATDRFSSGIYHLHLSDDTRWLSGANFVVE